MVPHRHHSIGFSDAIETRRSHSSLVWLRHILSHFSKRDLFPFSLEAWQTSSAGQQLLHEGLTAAVLGFNEGVEFFEDFVPGGEDVGDLFLLAVTGRVKPSIQNMVARNTRNQPCGLPLIVVRVGCKNVVYKILVPHAWGRIAIS